ncbi:MAG: RiPP maturation radical SAM C-methyltransferase [Acidobacteria bacterium]|nr:RiPP maturation radical SAM C-methyltransferase [Acidobacteriota bacterium]
MKTTSAKSDVLLITMPFGPLIVPSIGLSLLKATLINQGFSAQIRYFTFRFAERIGIQNYAYVADDTTPTDLIGEWIFSGALHGDQVGQADSKTHAYIDEVLRKKSSLRALNSDGAQLISESTIEEILSARDQVESFLDECLNYVLARKPKVVGFTSTFHQNVAALALAKRIKARSPETFIVFGGANCEGIMGQEISRQFAFVDAVVSGEGEVVLPEIVRRVLTGQPIGHLPGVFTRLRGALPVVGQTAIHDCNALTVKHMDDLPFPDYEDFFEQLADCTVTSGRRPTLLFETARGCWWGEKHHCTFCGLNGQGMAFRSKSPDRALTEFLHLTGKYPGHAVSVVDNILSMDYLKNFIPMLADSNPGVEVFFEIKSNLRKEQLVLLRAAGVTRVQPGIESLSDQVLRLMDKGVRALQNIQLLKWCKELGISPQWNLIWGFPGEKPEEYEQMAKWIPLLVHLPPPVSSAHIRIDRFSPNFDRATQLGFKNLAPYPSYGYVYRFPEQVVANLACFFTAELVEPRDAWQYVEPVVTEVRQWQERHPDSTLFFVEKGERLLIWDSRASAQESFVVLTGRDKFIYQACDQTRTARQVFELWQPHSTGTTLTNLRAALDALVARGLMLRQDDSYLSLAIPTSLQQ